VAGFPRRIGRASSPFLANCGSQGPQGNGEPVLVPERAADGDGALHFRQEGQQGRTAVGGGPGGGRADPNQGPEVLLQIFDTS
jgi:hypothetical protein